MCIFIYFIGEKGDSYSESSQADDISDGNDDADSNKNFGSISSSDNEEEFSHKIPSSHVCSILPHHRFKVEPDLRRPQLTLSSISGTDDSDNHKYTRLFSTPSPGTHSPLPHDSPLDLTCKTSESALTSICSNLSSTKTCSDNIEKSSLNSLQSRFGGRSSIIDNLSNTMSSNKNPLYNAFGGNLYTSALYNTAPLMTTDQLYKPERKYWPLSVTSPMHHGKSSRHVDLKNQNNNNTSKSTNMSAAQPSHKKMKVEVSTMSSAPAEVSSPEKDKTQKYTNLTCSCQKQYDSLYDLTMHMQATGHIANVVKFNEHAEYPKLVRGQDMWLNQGSEQTRRILRCMQCAESFISLPELTIHMIKTKHYTNIVGGESKKTHRCSSYCDKCEDTNKSVFRCKMCHNHFPDMESLADHMMISGHYMKSSSGYETQDLSPTSTSHTPIKNNNHPSNSSIPFPHIHHHRSYMESHPLDTDEDDLSDFDATTQHSSGTDKGSDAIRCENCDVRICTDVFVDHIRICEKTRMSPIDICPTFDTDDRCSNGDIRVKPEETVDSQTEVKPTWNYPDAKHELLPTPKGRALLEYYKDQHSPKTNKSSSALTPPPMPSLQDKYLCPDSPLSVDVSQSKGFMECLKNCIDKHTTTSDKSKVSSYTFPKSFKQSEPIKSSVSFSSSSLSPRNVPYSPLCRRDSDINQIQKLTIMNPKPLEKKSHNSKHCPVGNFKDRSSPHKPRTKSPWHESSALPIRVLSPDLPSLTSSSSEPTSSIDSSNSALEAMQSLIERSFYSNNLMTAHTMKSQKKYYQKGTTPTTSKHSHNYQIPDSTAPDVKPDREKLMKKSDKFDETVKVNGDVMHGTKVMVKHTSTKSRADKNIYEKYLTNSVNQDNQSNALDSLHGLVYGEGVEFDHPLDSLQKLIHTTDIIPAQRSGSNGTRSSDSSSIMTGKVIPPSGHSLPSTVILVNPIVTVMSNKTMHGSPSLQINIPSKICSSSPPNCSATPSSPSPHHRKTPGVPSPISITFPHSPTRSLSPATSTRSGDGRDVGDAQGVIEDIHCNACKLTFTSRGEYRLHQRYCPVGTQGPPRKDSLNITSPYIYMPLDHASVKFSKYYEMASELANTTCTSSVE